MKLTCYMVVMIWFVTHDMWSYILFLPFNFFDCFFGVQMYSIVIFISSVGRYALIDMTLLLGDIKNSYPFISHLYLWPSGIWEPYPLTLLTFSSGWSWPTDILTYMVSFTCSTTGWFPYVIFENFKKFDVGNLCRIISVFDFTAHLSCCSSVTSLCFWWVQLIWLICTISASFAHFVWHSPH